MALIYCEANKNIFLAEFHHGEGCVYIQVYLTASV